MNAGKAYASAFKNLFKFTGRASKSEFWYVYPVFITIILIESYFGNLIAKSFFRVAEYRGVEEFYMYGYMISILNLFIAFCHLPLLARRLHDCNINGAWVIPAIIPLLSILIALIFCTRDGTKGDNKYGPDPLANNG